MSKTPKKIRVYTSTPSGKETLHWEVTLREDGTVDAQAKVENPFYPTVFDKEEDRYLSPEDGPKFMRGLLQATHNAFVSIEVVED